LEQLNDPTLLAELRLGNETAFDTLFRAYYASLCRYASGVLDGSLDDAEDVVQQVFIKIWEQRQGLEIQWSLKAYLYKMTHNRCLNRLRDARTREKHHQENAIPMEQQQYDPNVSDSEQELSARVQKALRALPTECRRIFELSRFEALKYREIADQLGISIKTVETQMGKALRILRVELSDYVALFIGWIFWKSEASSFAFATFFHL
jgi:RNA polymerase sigma-70 factor (ECF subfamily)